MASQNENTEITIDDIYNRMHTATKIDTRYLRVIQQIELETEKELSFLNAAIVNEIKPIWMRANVSF